MKLSEFDYYLPKELIAQYPLPERDKARLLVLDRVKNKIEHRIFSDITDYLSKNDLLVLNNTKVLSCRILARRPSGGKVEILLLKQKDGLVFECFVKPGKVKLGEKFIFDSGKIFATLTGESEVTFQAPDLNSVYGLGVMPLPPYIKRDAEELDNIYYQTVYAKEPGAVAAPTAGLHFTEELIKKIKLNGVNFAYLTLHVGPGTFKPVKIEDITKHKMEAEYFKVGEKAQEFIGKARLDKSRIIAVGTTALRALEAYACGKDEGDTDLFVYPGFEFKLANCLLTNFHLPRTTLFMLVCAFAGTDLVKKAYSEAIDKKYRFYSYGDAMLII